MNTGLWPQLTLTIPLPLCLLPRHTHTQHTHTQSLGFPKPSQTPFFCPSDQSLPGVERDLTHGRGEGPCCLASRQCGKRQAGSSKDDQRAPSPHPGTDGALNPLSFLKAMHDRGGRLFCHHRKIDSHKHLKRHTCTVFSLAVSHFHFDSATHTLSLLLYHYITDPQACFQSVDAVLSPVICITWLLCRHFSSIIFFSTVWACDTD